MTTVPVVERSDLSGLTPDQNAELDIRIGPVNTDVPFMTLVLDRPTPKVEVQHNLSFIPGIVHIRESGQETTLPFWRNIDAMNQAVTDVLTALAAFS